MNIDNLNKLIAQLEAQPPVRIDYAAATQQSSASCQ